MTDSDILDKLEEYLSICYASAIKNQESEGIALIYKILLLKITELRSTQLYKR